MTDMFRVGVIASTHGVRGEVKVYPTTDDNNRFKKLKQVLLDTGKEQKSLTLEQVRFFKNMVIIKFKEFNDINEVEKYKGMDLLVTRENAVKLKKDEYFIADLIGLKVMTDEGEELGLLEDVMLTGANDVYIVKGKDDKEILLPVIKECVLDISLEKQEILVHIMEGLLEL